MKQLSRPSAIALTALSILNNIKLSESTDIITAHINQSATLPCKINSVKRISPLKTSWLKGNQWLGTLMPGHLDESKYSYVKENKAKNDFSIEILKVELADDGLYSCQQTEDKDIDRSKIVRLNVISPPDLDSIELKRENILQRDQEMLSDGTIGDKDTQKASSTLQSSETYLKSINENSKSKILIVSESENSIECLVRGAKPAAEVEWFNGEEKIMDAKFRFGNETEHIMKGLYWFWGDLFFSTLVI